MFKGHILVLVAIFPTVSHQPTTQQHLNMNVLYFVGLMWFKLDVEEGQNLTNPLLLAIGKFHPTWHWKSCVKPLLFLNALPVLIFRITPRHPVIPPELWCFSGMFLVSKYRTLGGGHKNVYRTPSNQIGSNHRCCSSWSHGCFLMGCVQATLEMEFFGILNDQMAGAWRLSQIRWENREKLAPNASVWCIYIYMYIYIIKHDVVDLGSTSLSDLAKVTFCYLG